MKKILVIGDSCSDVFVYGKCLRLSPEAPVPIFNQTRTTGNGGMAINVYENLKALGLDCDIITNDIRPVKTRYIDEASNQMLLRIDGKDEIKRIDSEIILELNYTEYEVIVISDYNKGFLTTEEIEYISLKHPIVFMDTKKKLDYWANNVAVIKINEKEANENINQEWLNQYQGELVITLGQNGAKHGHNLYPITLEHNIRDLSGAGDTFLAGLVAEYIKNNDICKSIKFANRCASWVVTQKGVITVDLNRI